MPGKRPRSNKQYADGKKLQDERDDLFRRIKNAESDRVSQCKNICGNFRKSMSPFFSLSLIDRALSLLSRHYLAQFMQRKTGDISLLEFVPPKSISNVSEFNAESRYRVAKYVDLVKETQDKLARISEENTEISDLTKQLQSVEKKLSGKDVSEKVNEIDAEIQACKSTIRRCSSEHDRLIKDIGYLEAESDREWKERETLTLNDEKNRQTQIHLMYVQEIYDELQSFYSEREKETRERLQNTINNIFKQIYEGGLHLTIDEKYHISVQADDYCCGVETSTAQSISAIFAFILSIIRMAKENRTSDDPNARMLSSEPYPLVMAAPFSSFDKLRIRRVCEIIPSIAEQIIIFTKDNDGELIEDYMGAKIGSRHWLYKQNEFDTVLA